MSVVIPTFRRPDVLRETLEALLDVDYPSDLWEVIVVDDGAEQETREVVERFSGDGPRVVYLAQDHAGVAAARNRGAESATGELIVFVDDDIIVEPDHLHRHLEDQARFDDALVNGHWEFSSDVRVDLESTPFGRFRIAVEDWVKEGIEKEKISTQILRPSGVTACNLSIRAETFARLGGFDDEFPYAGCEDQDFSLRATEAGLPFIYDRSIRLQHHDRRVTLREFGERQRRGAMTHVLLASRHPAVREESGMLRENGPLRRGEPFRVSAKKVIKRALARPAGFALLDFAAGVLERVAPRSRLLRRLYWSTLGVYIYAGISDGLRAEPEPLPSEQFEPA